MRWLLIFLLMCNGIYFLWQHYLVTPEPAGQVATSQLQQSGESLVLISEVPAQESDLQASPEALGEPAEKKEPLLCLMIGPFKDEVTGKQVLTRLAALDIHPKMEAINVPGKPNYWVHIPPQSSRKVAIKLLRELQSKNIDSFLISKGELENGISLGIFTKLASAEGVSAKRVKEGYDARVLTVPSSRKELWAVFSAEQTEKFSDPLWNTIREGNSSLQRRKNYCDKIAPPYNFD
jgi:hypothetical protein